MFRNRSATAFFARIEMGGQRGVGAVAAPDNIQHDQAVAAARVLIQTGQHAFVAGKLGTAVELRGGRVYQRIEPVQRERKQRGELDRQVVPAVMGQLVRENAAQRFRRKIPLRQNDPRMQPAVQHRAARRRTHIQRDGSPDAEFPAKLIKNRLLPCARETQRALQTGGIKQMLSQTDNKGYNGSRKVDSCRRAQQRLRGRRGERRPLLRLCLTFRAAFRRGGLCANRRFAGRGRLHGRRRHAFPRAGAFGYGFRRPRRCGGFALCGQLDGNQGREGQQRYGYAQPQQHDDPCRAAAFRGEAPSEDRRKQQKQRNHNRHDGAQREDRQQQRAHDRLLFSRMALISSRSSADISSVSMSAAMRDCHRPRQSFCTKLRDSAARYSSSEIRGVISL